MAEGRTNAAIARELVVSDGAVEKHVSNIFTKLDLPPDRGRPPPRARRPALAGELSAMDDGDIVPEA